MSLACGIRLAHGWITPTTLSVNPKYTQKRHTVSTIQNRNSTKPSKTQERQRNSRKKTQCFGKLAENRSKKGVHSKVLSKNLSVFFKRILIDHKYGIKTKNGKLYKFLTFRISTK